MKMNVIFPTEQSVLEYMKNRGLKRLRMYITAYVNHMNYQDYGYTLNNVNSNYYHSQQCIKSKTKQFVLN